MKTTTTLDALLDKILSDLRPHGDELLARMKSNDATATDYLLYTQIRRAQLMRAATK